MQTYTQDEVNELKARITEQDELIKMYRAAAARGYELESTQDVLRKIIDDYDRRREHWWGRFLLWLLWKTA